MNNYKFPSLTPLWSKGKGNLMKLLSDLFSYIHVVSSIWILLDPTHLTEFTENTFLSKLTGGAAKCFCGKLFSSRCTSGIISYHFQQSHAYLLPDVDTTAQHFGGTPFQCLDCNREYIKENINIHKLHLATAHKELLEMNEETMLLEISSEKSNGKQNKNDFRTVILLKYIIADGLFGIIVIRSNV